MAVSPRTPRAPRPWSVVDELRGGLVVSCQAPPGHPLDSSACIAALARCAELGGAAAVRIDGPVNIAATAEVVGVPVIGIAKSPRAGARPYITPQYMDCVGLVEAGAAVIALEATHEYRPNAVELRELCARLHEELNVPAMVDVSTLDEGVAAWEAGADLVATTLSGYTPASAGRAQPDIALVAELAAHGVRTVLEGNVREPRHVAEGFGAGAWAVVVGTAITAPDAITRRFGAATPRARAQAHAVGAADALDDPADP